MILELDITGDYHVIETVICTKTNTITTFDWDKIGQREDTKQAINIQVFYR